MLDGKNIIVMGVFLGFVVPVSHLLHVLSDMVVDALAGVIMVFVTGIGVEVLTGVNINVFVSITTCFGVCCAETMGETELSDRF